MGLEMDTDMRAEMESGDGKQRYGPRSLFPRTPTLRILQTATLSCLSRAKYGTNRRRRNGPGCLDCESHSNSSSKEAA